MSELEQLREELELAKTRLAEVQANRETWVAQAGKNLERAEQAERFLCDLTPSGSEFADDPKRCYEWVRECMSRRFRMLGECAAARRQAEQERDEAHAEVADLLPRLDADAVLIEQAGRAMAERDALIAALREALEDAEWSVSSDDDTIRLCPVCGADEDEGHGTSCFLGATLALTSTAQVAD